MSNDFQEFLVKKQSEASTERGDERKEKWLRSLERLYSRLEGYLEPYVKDGSIRLERDKIILREELIGTYTAPTLRMWIADTWVEIVPAGTFVGGAVGRVDLSGIKRSRSMVQREWDKWIILGRSPGEIPFGRHSDRNEIELSEEEFEKLLIRLAR
jgi:hypothetical protein